MKSTKEVKRRSEASEALDLVRQPPGLENVPRHIRDSIVLSTLIEQVPSLNQTAMKRLLSWRWERLRKTLHLLQDQGWIRKVDGAGRSSHYFIRSERPHEWQRTAEQAFVRPGLTEVLVALEAAGRAGRAVTQKDWLALTTGRRGWSRRNFQRRIKRLVDLGAVEVLRLNQHRRCVYYFPRPLIGGQPVAPSKDWRTRHHRMIREVYLVLFPKGIEHQEREARRIAEEQDLLLDPPMRPASDVTPILQLKHTWVLIEQGLIFLDQESILWIHSVLEDLPYEQVIRLLNDSR